MTADLLRKLLKSTRLYALAQHTKRSLLIAGEQCPAVYKLRGYTSSKLVRILLKIIVTPFYISGYFRYRDIPGREGLAFVMIAKNEAPYVEEWINFHRKQGAAHFLIYDNESKDNLQEVLKPYIESGLVTYLAVKGRPRQMDVYNMTIHEHGHKFKYMAFIDADEFLFVRSNTQGGGSIYEFVDRLMSEHPEAGGLIVNWCLFGSSGHAAKPEGGVLENYIMRAEDSYYRHERFKTICDPLKAYAFLNAHWPYYRKGFYEINEDGEIPQPLSIHFSKIRINHYFTKSKEEFMAKIARGRNSIIPLPESEFDKQDRNEVLDTEILSLSQQ